jgi:hypothetical protein
MPTWITLILADSADRLSSPNPVIEFCLIVGKTNSPSVESARISVIQVYNSTHLPSGECEQKLLILPHCGAGTFVALR